MDANTLFLRLEGPMQAWGDHQSKFVVRRTAEAPTKSGVIGLLCAALGVERHTAAESWIPTLSELRMGVRVDRPGVFWWDYHTVGARLPMRTAEGKTKPGAMLTRREYLCDASFLVALQGDPVHIGELWTALRTPRWTLFLGRKSCPPTRPLWEHPPGRFEDLGSALSSVPWARRLKKDPVPGDVALLLEWRSTSEVPHAPADAETWYDVPVTFQPPAHLPRLLVRRTARVGNDGEIPVAPGCLQNEPKAPPRTRADYRNSEYRKRRAERLAYDHHLCVFCKSYAETVQHVTYRRAGGGETHEDLRALCRLCHDAVTMIEYGLGMGMDRIDPEEPRWRDAIIAKREEIIRYRSLETRRRRLSAEEV